MSFREAVLLMEGEERFRVTGLTQPGIDYILERERVDFRLATTVRHWHWFGEKDLKGNRIFREQPFDTTAVAHLPADEHPLNDEVNLKVALNRTQLDERSDTKILT